MPSEQAVAERQLSMAEAVREALAQEMRRDPRVFMMGEDVAEAGTPFRVLRGLVEEFGQERVMDTPISEPGFTGIALGSAITGMRPVVDIMFGDFLFLALDQIANQAAKVHYMSGGKLNAPIVIRTTLGATLPSTPYDAKGLMKSAIRDDNPVVIFEDKMMYTVKGAVPEDDYTIPFGQADVKREGDDITLVATSSMVYVALAAADLLAGEGISAEVIDPRTTVPLDTEALVRSAMKTGHAIVIDEGYQSYGVTAEIASVIADGAFYQLDAPVKRMGAMDVPIPFSPALEDLTVPTPEKVADLSRELLRKGN